LIIKWAQLGSNLDSPLIIGPVDQFRRGLDSRGGSRLDGTTEAMIKPILLLEHY